MSGPEPRRMDKRMTADAAVALVGDGESVALVGGGGGLIEAADLLEAIERRFLSTGHPRDLTLVHSLGIGDRKQRGTNRFAHEGMVRRAIGGHWSWSPGMQALARDDKIEAYVLPGGVMMQQMREIAAKRPGLITHVGLGTFVDPRQTGGRANARARDSLVELIEIDGREYLRYRPFPVTVALLRGSAADPAGNISLDEEPANCDLYAVALAAHNSGGKVIVQVRHIVPAGSLPARSVRIPSAIVDAVVHCPDQMQSHAIHYDPSISGEKFVPQPRRPLEIAPIRLAIARRAKLELRDGAVVNYGFGVPDGVAKLVAEAGEVERVYQTIEHGTYGGELMDGAHFGFAHNPTCMIDGPSQFDFYAGGGLDIAFLGFGEADAAGNVNVSKLGGLIVGPGGFIDIAQNARKVVFCGSFDAKGTEVEIGDGRLTVRRHGAVCKFVPAVDQITFAGAVAVARGQEALYVTERAVFRLTPDGPELIELAPGCDLRRDVLDRMEFAPRVASDLRPMPAVCFQA